MVSDGAAGKAARMRCHAPMASGFHDYNPKTNYQKKEGGAVPEARPLCRVSGAVVAY
jgi:hypothetical protein